MPQRPLPYHLQIVRCIQHMQRNVQRNRTNERETHNETEQQKDRRTTNRMRNIDLGINLDLQEENMIKRKGKDNKIQTNTEETKKTCSIQPSRVVPHRSTTWTRPSLTSLFGWEAVTLGDVAASDNIVALAIYILT